ncbi:MAG TPA: M28 family peptidase [Anaerolineales bacterium]|nr:M28 family peptidase [Anaerolineales bacterium]
MTKRLLLTLGLLAIVIGGYYGWRYTRIHRWRDQSFNAERAYQDVVYQTSLGPRTPDSDAHEQAIDYFRSELQKANWLVEVQVVEVNGHILKNVIARRSDMPPEIILGAHYDSRLMADKDPDPKKQLQPVPGANDGASGTAVLLDLGRVLPPNSVPVWLVFFDGEDQGNLPGWEEWALGARGFVETFTLKPRAVVIVDMVGDYNLNIHQEKQSSQRLINEIWQVARELGYGQYFLEERKYSIMDDHVPFLEAGIPAVDIIDIEYRYWHTSYDTAENVSPVSLGIVGSTLQIWIARQK